MSEDERGLAYGRFDGTGEPLPGTGDHFRRGVGLTLVVGAPERKKHEKPTYGTSAAFVAVAWAPIISPRPDPPPA